jgi:hypothetical protein
MSLIISNRLLNNFLIQLFSPPPASPLQAVRALVNKIERITKERLTVLSGAHPGPKKLKDRDKWLKDEFSRQTPNRMIIPGLSNGVHGPGYVGVSGGMGGSRPDRPSHVAVTVPLSRAELCEPLLCGLVAVLKSWWARASAGALGVFVLSQIRPQTLPGCEPSEPFQPPPGFPELEFAGNLDSPLRPDQLGWLNYWSAEAAKLAGLKDAANNEDIAQIRREGAGWFIELTKEPLDPSKPDHLECLRNAYRRFPGVGRMPERDARRRRARP